MTASRATHATVLQLGINGGIYLNGVGSMLRGMLSAARPFGGRGLAWTRGRPPRRLRITAFVSSLVLVIAGFSAPFSEAAASAMPATPQQQAGTAAGRSHTASAASTTATKSTLPNSAAGRAPGALPAYAAHARTVTPTNSGSRIAKAPAAKPEPVKVSGFNAQTSVEQPALDTADAIVYKNADGTYTSHVYPHAVNTRQASGRWARIAGATSPTPTTSATAGATTHATGSAVSGSATSNADTGADGDTTAETYVESGVTENFDGNGQLYVGQYNGNNYNSFLQFSNFGTTQFPNAYIVGATLELDTEYSGLVSSTSDACSSQPVNVAPVTQNWSPSTLESYPGPSAGAQIGTASFSAGTDCSNGRAYEGVPISTTSTLMNWAHGWASNYGLALTAPLTSQGAKEFYANDAYLAVTYTPDGEGASYSEVSYASPWNNAAGFGNVTVENEGSATWTPTNGFKLTYEIYTVGSTGTLTLDSSVTPTATAMPSTVAPNKSVTVNASIIALTPGPSYDVCWDMENGTTKFSSLGVPAVCYALPVVNNPPIITAYSPDNNENVYTLTPTVGVSAYDPDNYPDKGLLYSFELYQEGSTTAVASATSLSTSTWTVPSGTLSYGTTYYWQAQVSDTVTPSAWSAPDYFNVTSAPQPLVTSQLSVPAYGSTVQGVDPQVGNFTTVVTDADYAIPGFGPGLEVQRTYNSLNPELYNSFGAGWSSILDMRATPDNDGSGNVVVTLADGQQERFGLNGNGTFSPPAGGGGTLIAGPLPGTGDGGYTFIDTSGVRYNFDMTETDPVTGQAYFGLGNAWDANGHGLDFVWVPQTLTLPSGGTVSATLPGGAAIEVDGQDGINGDTIGNDDDGNIQLSWGVSQVTTSAGATLDIPHVTSVYDQDFNGNDTDVWTYGYNASNQLASVCAPATSTTTSTSCASYSYTSGADSGSHFASMVLSSNPTEYWRLDDAAGSATAADSVAVNEGADNAKLTNVTPGQTGALAGSPATSASFDGTNSYMSLPSNMMATSDNPTIGMWFKTTQAGGTLFSYQAAAPGTAATSNYTPALYVGTDGKLHAEFYDGKSTPMSSTSAVDDGKWHYVVLTGNGDNQTLFLDGAQVATRAGSPITESGEGYDTVGAGEIAGSWPDAPSANALGYFSGDVEDVNFLQHPLGLPEVQQEYSSGVNAAAELTQMLAPSGKTQDTLTYNALTDRATAVTDSDGGTYTVGTPSTTGSDDYYYGAVMASRPYLDYPLNESSGLVAVDDSGTDNPPGPTTDGYYNNVMLGEPGVFGSSGDTAAGFNGSSSYLSLPNGSFNDKSGSASIAVWFNTKTAGGVLFSYQNGAIGSALSANYTPALYIGGNGKLYGEIYDGKASPMVSTSTVDDGNWHLAVITATGTTQTLYLDGTQIATRTGSSIAGEAESLGETTATVGAGYVAGSWPEPPSNAEGYFNGEIAQVGVYQLDIDQTTPTAEASLYQARGSSTTLTPTTSVAITDPGNHTETYTFDPSNADRATSYTNALGQTTTYAYDTLGFQDASTDPDGHSTSREHDKYGNVVETTSCQTQSSCQTSYYSYYEDTANPRDPDNGKVLKAADARAGSTGTANAAYTTTYTYTPNGTVASVTTPPTTGYPRGQTTTYTYYIGTETNGPNSNQPEPYGMLATVTDPRGEVTSYTYDEDGLVYSETDPSGQQKFYTYTDDNQLASECVSSDTYPETQQPSGYGWDYTVCPQEYTYTYEADGQVATETQPETTDAVTGKQHTQVTTYYYDVDGNVTSAVVSDSTGGDASRTTSYTYNAGNRVASVTDPDGNVTSYTYDDFGNEVTRDMPNGAVYSYTYTPTGLQLTTTLTNWTGNPESPTSAADLVIDSRQYDPAGRLASDTDSMGRTTAYTYFDNNLIATQTQASGTSSAQTTAYTYDAAGNMASECVGQTSTGGCGKLTDYSVNAQNQTTQTTVDPSGVDQTTTDHFDPDGDVLSQILTGNGETAMTTYTYNAAGNKTSQSVLTGNSGPAGYWPMNDGDATSAADSSGNGNPAVAAGGVTWGQPGDNYTTLNGTSGQLATAKPVLNTNPGQGTNTGYTVSAWVDLKTASTTSDETIVSQDGNETSAFQLEYNHTAKSWDMVMPGNDAASPTTIYTAPDPTAAATGTWTQVVGVFDADLGWVTLYVNGALVNGVGAPGAGDQQTTDSTPFASSGSTVIGRGKASGAAANFFSGQIRNVQVFQTALNATDISDLYSAGSTAGQSEPDFDATGFWKLNDGEAGAAADDSGHGDAAALGGDSYWTSDGGGALVTDGTSGGGASTSAPAVNTSGNFTVSAWAKPAATGTGTQTIATQQGNEAGGFSLDFDGATDRWDFDRATTDAASPTIESAQSTAAPTVGTWTHLTGVYTASTGAMQLYVNGVAQGTATDTTPIASNGAFDIGHGFSAGAAANYFNGEIRDVQAYDSALSSSQVSTLYTTNGTVGTSASTTTWTYDERGYPKTTVSPDGNVPGATAANYTTTYAYDQLGELTSTSTPPVSLQSDGSAPTTAVETTMAGYDTFGDQAEVSDPDGNITTVTYNGDGEKTALSLPAYTAPGSSTSITPTMTYGYDALGDETSMTDGLTNTTDYTYDQLGDQVQVSAPNNEATEKTYDTDGELLSTTDPTGGVTQATYNPLGEEATSTQEERYPTPEVYTTDYGYDALGDQTSVGDPAGDSNSSTYNALGQLTSATDGLSEKTSYTYDLSGQVAKETAPDGTSAVNTYNEAGLETGTEELSASGAVQSSESYGYDAAGNQLTATNPLGATTTSTYNALNELTAQSQPATGSTAIKTSFGYDADGNETSYTDPNGNTTVYTYNTLGLQESQIDPTVTGYTTSADDTTTVAYNADGEPVTVTQPGGVATTSTFDADGNVTGQSGSGAEAATTSDSYGYNADNEMTSYSAPSGTNTITYDDRGLPLSTAGPDGNETFDYDADGRMTSQSDASGTFDYAYNNGSEVTSESDPLTGTTVGYSYNSLDQVSGVTYGTGGPTESISYNPMHEETGDTLDAPSGSAEASIGYTYNSAGEVTNETTSGTIGAGSSTYTYDEAGRLASDTDNGVATQYAYDASGNLTTNGGSTASYNARDELTSATSGSSTSNYSYTARGTLSSETTGSTTTNYTDNAYDQQVTAGSGSYTYDSLGRLATAGTSGSSYAFTYAGTSDNVTSDGVQQFGDAPDGSPLSVASASGSAGSGSFLDTDLHGDVIGSFSSTGSSLAGSTEYSPWGQVQASSGSGADLGYQGGWTDSSTGLVNADARWYSPSNGGFTSQDTQQNSPVPAVNANPFAYADDDPLDNADPSGHDACTDNDTKWQEEQAEERAEIQEEKEQEAIEQSEREQAEEIRENEAAEEAEDEEWAEESAEQEEAAEDSVDEAIEEGEQEAADAADDIENADPNVDDGNPGDYDAGNGSDVANEGDPGYDEAYDYEDFAVDAGEDDLLDVAGDFLADYGVDLLVIALFSVGGDPDCGDTDIPDKPTTPTEPPASETEPVQGTNESQVTEEANPNTVGETQNTAVTESTSTETSTGETTEASEGGSSSGEGPGGEEPPTAQGPEEGGGSGEEGEGEDEDEEPTTGSKIARAGFAGLNGAINAFGTYRGETADGGKANWASVAGSFGIGAAGSYFGGSTKLSGGWGILGSAGIGVASSWATDTVTAIAEGNEHSGVGGCDALGNGSFNTLPGTLGLVFEKTFSAATVRGQVIGGTYGALLGTWFDIKDPMSGCYDGSGQ
jgi:RHS repeat-associated protein